MPVPLAHKMWILPDASVQPLTCWHWQWLQSHPSIYRKFKIQGVAAAMGEVPGRKCALRAGFFRVNYEKHDGGLTIEGCRRSLRDEIKDAVFMIVADNAPKIDRITINLFDYAVEHLDSTATAFIFRYGNKEKCDHIPLVSDSARGRALRTLLKQGGRPLVKVNE